MIFPSHSSSSLNWELSSQSPSSHYERYPHQKVQEDSVTQEDLLLLSIPPSPGSSRSFAVPPSSSPSFSSSSFECSPRPSWRSLCCSVSFFPSLTPFIFGEFPLSFSDSDRDLGLNLYVHSINRIKKFWSGAIIFTLFAVFSLIAYPGMRRRIPLR